MSYKLDPMLPGGMNENDSYFDSEDYQPREPQVCCKCGETFLYAASSKCMHTSFKELEVEVKQGKEAA